MHRVRRQEVNAVASARAEAVKAVEAKQRDLQDVALHHLLSQVHREASDWQDRLKVGPASQLLRAQALCGCLSCHN